MTNRTNRFETHAARPETLWATAGMPGVSSSAYCLGSIPTITSVGGVLEQKQLEDLNSLHANFDSRQMQM